MRAQQFLCRTAALTVLAAALAGPARAGWGAWTPLGPDGGNVTAVAVAPSDPRVVYAGTEAGGIFKSTDGGASWAAASSGLGAGNTFPHVTSLAVEPRASDRVYASTLSSGVYGSRDGGRSWAPRSTGLPASRPFPGRVERVVIDPFDPRIVWAATPRGVFRSRNGGMIWAERGQGLNGQGVLTLGFDPAGRSFYAGLQSGGVYRSDDRGATWRPARTGLPAAIYSLGFDPRTPETVFAGADKGLFRSRDRGRSWSQVGKGIVTGRVFSIGFQESTARFFVGTTLGFQHSADGGTTWRYLQTLLPSGDVRALEVAPRALYAGVAGMEDEGGVYKSPDGGLPWVRGHGLSTLAISDLVFDPSNPATLYLRSGKLRLFRSSTGGTSWNRLQPEASYPIQALTALAINPGRPDTVYLASDDVRHQIQRSDDGGTTWRTVTESLFESFYYSTLEPDPRTPEGLWGGGYGGLASRHSADGGATWQAHGAGANYLFLQIEQIVVDPLDPAHLFYAGSSVVPIDPRVAIRVPRLFETRDAGATWSLVRLDELGLGSGDLVRIACTEAGCGTVYLASDRYLYEVDLAARSLPRPLLNLGLRGGSFVVTPGAQPVLYAARRLAGVLRSTDGGRTWTPLRAGLGSREVLKLWVDPHNPRHLFAGTQNGGLYEYTEPS